MRWLSYLLLAIASLAPLTANDGPRVVVSHPIIEDWVRLLAGNTLQVRCLTPRESDPHAFQPNPRQVKDLLEADWIIGFDPLLEPWLREVINSNKLTNRSLWIAKGWISDLGAELACCPSEQQPAKHTLLRSRQPVDPHVWTDPTLVAAMGKILHKQLRVIAPKANEGELQLRLAAFLEMTERVDLEIKNLLKAIPQERRGLITHHGNLGRFAQRYNLRIEGVLLRSSTTEAADPSAREMARYIALARDKQVSLVVIDYGQRAPSAATLAREANLPAPLALRIDTLATEGKAATWEGMMREAGQALGTALAR